VNFSRDFSPGPRYNVGMSTNAAAAASPDCRLRVPDRTQVVMTVASLDQVLAGDHPARVVWAVVERLDLSAFRAAIRARAGVPGRDATDPRVLVGAWLYAAVDGVGSARELARLCAESDPYRWLLGGVSVNHHTLSDFRVGHADALDELFTRVIASLAERGLVTVHRIAQDGTRVRACAGSSSFRRRGRLEALLGEARAHVAELRGRLDDPAQSAGLSARQRAARERAARERLGRVEQAVAALPGLEARQRESRDATRRGRAPRVSTTDPQARVMKMPDGGFRPAVNVQLAVDTASRAVVGVDVTDAGSDAGLTGPMRAQVERRAGRAVAEQVVDGGYLVMGEIEAAAAGGGPTLFVPPKPPRDPGKAGTQYDPRPGDSDAVRAWRARMKDDAGRAAMTQRSATVETVNADLKTHRNLGPRLLVRGLTKARCVALWAALAYNLMLFARELVG
jgi:transposase